jgi:hypothetical protein
MHFENLWLQVNVIFDRQGENTITRSADAWPSDARSIADLEEVGRRKPVRRIVATGREDIGGAAWLQARLLGFPNGAAGLPKTNAGSSTVLVDEFYTFLFEGAAHIFKCTRIRLPCSAFKVRNGLRGCFACL